MPNNWFQFKQFKIQQEHSAMKVGTDGVLLGAWATVPGPGSRVLDIGTGTGLIALMIAQRTDEVEVDAVEMEPSSARQAEENFRNSPWKDRIRCTEARFQDYAAGFDRQYDLLICNPPFFTRSFKTPSRARNMARHDDALSPEELFAGSLPLMKASSILSMILPAQKEARALVLMDKYGLNLARLTRVFPAPGKEAKRVLLECSPTPGTCIEDELTIETGTRHRYSHKFRKLVHEFYLYE